MFELVPYKHEHVLPMLEQKINFPLRGFFLNGHGRNLDQRGTAFTIMGNGIPLVCGAVDEIWVNRGTIWCMFNEKSKTNFVPVFRLIKQFLDDSKYNRIEVCIPCDMALAKRRALLLGFKLECAYAPKYLPDGTDCSVYALVKGL